MFDKVPPHNLEAERAILGAMLTENGLIPKVVQRVVPDMFYAEVHQEILKAVVINRR